MEIGVWAVVSLQHLSSENNNFISFELPSIKANQSEVSMVRALSQPIRSEHGKIFEPTSQK